MKALQILFLVVVCLCPGCAWNSGEGASKKKPHGPGLLSRAFHIFGKSSETPAAATTEERQIGSKRLLLSMTIEPHPLKLSENRQMKVTLHVSNKTKKLVQLEFPTTQRIEVLVKNQRGKLVEQWSEDRTFANEPGMVSVNPGEHLEYNATVSTRDMTAGETYSVEALFPNYEALRLQKTVTPER